MKKVLGKKFVEFYLGAIMVRKSKSSLSNPAAISSSTEPAGSKNPLDKEFTCPECGSTEFKFKNDGTHIDIETRVCWEDLVCIKCDLHYTQWYKVGKMFEQEIRGKLDV